MKATWGSDCDPDEKEAADQELPVTHCQVFTCLASWKPDIPDSCLGAGTGDAGARGRRAGGIQNENTGGSFTEMTYHN